MAGRIRSLGGTHITPWDEVNRDDLQCCWCAASLPHDTAGYFTLMPPWRDWRPVRFVCQKCVDSKSTWAHLALIDSIYLGIVEVGVPDLWMQSTTISFKPLDAPDSEPVDSAYRLYRDRDRPNVKPTAWLRLVKRDAQLLLCIHVENPKQGTLMHAAPIDQLELRNPTLGPLVMFPSVFDGITNVNLDVLRSATVSKHRMWWDKLMPRLLITGTSLISSVSDEREEEDHELVCPPDHPPTDECPDMECGLCAKRDCPQKDVFHFHHDGCPSCDG